MKSAEFMPDLTRYALKNFANRRYVPLKNAKLQ